MGDDKRIVDNPPEIARQVRDMLASRAGPSREQQALRLIAQRAQVAGPEDAEEALTWIYHTASAACEPRPQEETAHG
jgi:hypothetical protein